MTAYWESPAVRLDEATSVVVMLAFESGSGTTIALPRRLVVTRPSGTLAFELERAPPAAEEPGGIRPPEAECASALRAALQPRRNRTALVIRPVEAIGGSWRPTGGGYTLAWTEGAWRVSDLPVEEAPS
jgi:hypothetical protein